MSITQEAARSMMEGVGEAGLLIDGRKLFFEYRYDYTSFRGNNASHFEIFTSFILVEIPENLSIFIVSVACIFFYISEWELFTVCPC